MIGSKVNMLVGIAGPSCSGKTTLEHGLQVKLADEVAFLPFDEMFNGTWEHDGVRVTDLESPDLYRWEEYQQHLQDLQAGHEAVISNPQSRESRQHGLKEIVVEPRPIVVSAGFLVLHSFEINDLFDLKLYMDLPEEEIIRRRSGRAHPIDGGQWDSRQYITEKVIPAHRQSVFPQRGRADHIIDGMDAPEQICQTVVGLIESAKKDFDASKEV
jgi:uridine kinase